MPTGCIGLKSQEATGRAQAPGAAPRQRSLMATELTGGALSTQRHHGVDQRIYGPAPMQWLDR